MADNLENMPYRVAITQNLDNSVQMEMFLDFLTELDKTQTSKKPDDVLITALKTEMKACITQLCTNICNNTTEFGKNPEFRGNDVGSVLVYFVLDRNNKLELLQALIAYAKTMSGYAGPCHIHEGLRARKYVQERFAGAFKTSAMRIAAYRLATLHREAQTPPGHFDLFGIMSDFAKAVDFMAPMGSMD